MQQSLRNKNFYDKRKTYKYQLINYILDEFEKNKNLLGVILCEGNETSIDKAVYSAVFPDFLVIALGGCGSIPKILVRMRKILAHHRIYIFGIIDRDALSKSEIKQMHDATGIYTTKVPFIENIICTPKVLKYVCESRGVDYQEKLYKIQEALLRIIWRKMKETLPINLGISKEDTIESLEFAASTSDRTINKTVDRENVLYAYRSKRIVAIVANEFHLRRKEEYYKLIKQLLLDEKYHRKMVKAMSVFIPVLKAYKFEDYL